MWRSYRYGRENTMCLRVNAELLKSYKRGAADPASVRLDPDMIVQLSLARKALITVLASEQRSPLSKSVAQFVLGQRYSVLESGTTDKAHTRRRLVKSGLPCRIIVSIAKDICGNLIECIPFLALGLVLLDIAVSDAAKTGVIVGYIHERRCQKR